MSIKSGWSVMTAVVLVRAAVWASVEYEGVTYPTTLAEAESKGYVYMTNADPTSPRVSSFTNSVNWSDARIPHADAIYFSNKGWLLSPEAGGDVTTDEDSARTFRRRAFQGSRLVVAGGLAPCANSGTPDDPVKFSGDGLFVVNGGYFQNWGKSPYIDGPVTFLADSYIQGLPSTLASYTEMSFMDELRSPAGITVSCQLQWVQKYASSYGQNAVVLRPTCDTTEWLGTFAVQTNTTLVVQNAGFPGNVTLGTKGIDGVPAHLGALDSGLNGTLETAAEGTVTIGELRSNGGTAVIAATNVLSAGRVVFNGGKVVLKCAGGNMGGLRARESLTFAAGSPKMKLVLNADSTVLPAAKTCALVTAPTGSFTADDFEVENPGLFDLTFADDGTTATLAVLRRGVVETRQAFSFKDVAGVYNTPFDSATNNDGTVVFWTDDRAPHDDCDYVIRHGTALPCNAMGFYDKFQGHSLTVMNIQLSTGNNSPLCAGFFADDLRLQGATFQLWAGDDSSATRARYHGLRTFRLGGVLTAVDGTTEYFRPYGTKNGQFLAIESEVRGGGTMVFTCVNAATLNGYSYCEMTALNTNFTGKVTLTHPVYEKDSRAIPDDDICTRLFASDGRNLGGPLSAFVYDALKIEQHSALIAYQSLALDQANRGVYVNGVGRIEVLEGLSATVANPLTLNGTLQKEGLGTLALGGKLRFGLNGDLADETAPTAGSNRIVVTGGALKPVSVDALDGAALEFESGATLDYEAQPPAAGMRTNGPTFKKATPFAAAVAVRIVNAAGADLPDEFDVALGTFADRAAADAAAAFLKVDAKPFKGFRAWAPVVRENADGSATVVCAVKRTGFCLIFR